MSGFRASGALCVVLLRYVRPLDAVDAVDAQMKAHIDWLDGHFAAGTFLVAGRRDPRTGGVILAQGDRAAVEAIAATDPFVTSGVAEAEVVAFNASFAFDGLRALLAK